MAVRAASPRENREGGERLPAAPPVTGATLDPITLIILLLIIFIAVVLFTDVIPHGLRIVAIATLLYLLLALLGFASFGIHA